MSDCKLDFVCWPFKRVPGFLADSDLSLADRITADVMWAPLSGSGALGWGSWHGFESPGSLSGTFVAEISLCILNHHLWEWGQAFSHLYFPTSLNVASSANPWL